MIIGFAAGLLWYQLGDWSPASFFLGFHPVWVGMSVNIVVLIVVTLATAQWRVAVDARRRSRGALVAVASLMLMATIAATGTWLNASGLLGLAIFTAVALSAISTFLLTEPTIPRKAASTVEPVPAEEVPSLVEV
jgi:SSS family solute:Na+ symporter